MTRLGRAVLTAAAALAMAGAGPQRKPIQLTPPDSFPVPPVPPTRSAPFQVAPVPDSDVTAPLAAPQKGAQLRPDFFGQKGYNAGQGYIYGSTIEGQQEQRQKPIPGFNLKMPLQ